MSKKELGVTRSEMLQMREQGLSNRDIAKCLEISVATVYRYIGAQECRMANLAAFDEPKMPEETAEEKKSASPAVDTLKKVFEIVQSAGGTFRADVDYENRCCSLFDSLVEFDSLAELTSFIVGLTGRITKYQDAARQAFE